MILLKCDLCPFSERFEASDEFTSAFLDFGLQQEHWGPFFIRSKGVSIHACPSCRPKVMEIMLAHEDMAVAEIEARLKKADLNIVN